MSLLVSIHDVTPAHEPAVHALWDLCVAAGVRPALLVVPNWHGTWALEQFPGFIEWLLDPSREGSVILLHGYRHDEVGSRRQWNDELRAWGRTAREGEFLTLDKSVAWARIQQGLTSLRSIGLEPLGFVPPAWLARPETHQAVAEAGLKVSEDDRLIYRHPGDATPLKAPCIRWSTRTAFRSYGSAAVAEGRWLVQRNLPLVRLALHPGDLSRPVVRRSLVRTLERWLSAHEAVTYDRLLAPESANGERL
jgi:predicted deacetylase